MDSSTPRALDSPKKKQQNIFNFRGEFLLEFSMFQCEIGNHALFTSIIFQKDTSTRERERKSVDCNIIKTP